MTEDNKKSSNDQFADVIDQVNSNTNEALELLTNVNKEFEKLGNSGLDESSNVYESGQKVSKDAIKATVDSANETIKVVKSCIEGTLNLLKR